MSGGGGSILRRGKDKHLLIDEGAQSPPLPGPSATSTPNKYSPFNLKGIKHSDGVQVSYSNLAAQMDGSHEPTVSVSSPRYAADPISDKADASLDISNGTLEGSRWSVPSVSDRSWTPSAVRERIVKWPAWMSIKTFVGAICFLITVHGALSSGYVMAVITTIEKRFVIRSKTSGLVVSCYEFGSLLSVLFVSYFGSQGHVPRWIGVGSLLLAFGSILWTVPHFIASAPDVSNLQNGSGADQFDICPYSAPDQTCSTDFGEDTNPSSYVSILMIAQVLIGVGGSPIFTLGTTYIDNHVSKEDSSIYLAFMYVFVAFGPVCGFLLGALMLSRYVQPPAPTGVVMGSPSWIGCWWGGFILLGILYFIAAWPFFGFPRKLKNMKEPTASELKTDPTAGNGKSLKNIPFSVFRLITNSVYMITSLNACFDLAIVSGFTVFLPKYLETQFGVTKSIASVLTGSVAIPGACVGIFMGGWIMKRFKLQLKGVSRLIAVVNCICLFGMVLFFFLGCDNLHLAGVFKNYGENNPASFPVRQLQMSKQANLTNGCNIDCNCERHDYQPICAGNITYFSPCYAGCHSFTTKNTTDKSLWAHLKSLEPGTQGGESQTTPKVVPEYDTFLKCDCIPWNDNGTLTGGGEAKPGACSSNCKNQVPFLIYLFLLTLVASLNQMPLVMITLRAVSEEEKAFALGVQVVLLRLLAYIPAPILFGYIIDTTCLVWKPLCGEDGSTCLLYDVETFRTRYGFVVLILKMTAAALSLLLVWCIHSRGRGAEPFSPPITMSEIAHRLGDVDNLHIRACPVGMRSWMSDDSLYSRPRSPKRHQKTLSC